MKLLFTSILVALAMCLGQSQPPTFFKKTTAATRISQGIKIDGKMDEAAWATAVPAGDFTQNTPNPGKPANQRSEVWVLYDNTAKIGRAHV